MNAFPPLFAFTTDLLAVIAGLAACGLALLLGWRLVASRPATVSGGQGEDLDDSFLAGVTQDRRAAPRRKGNAVDVQLVDSKEQPPLRGWVLNRSQGGLGLLVDEAVPEGTVCRVRPSNSNSGWIEVSVRYCRREGGQYELGCQFHRTPNWNELLQFG
jgi:hypothetical protein